MLKPFFPYYGSKWRIAKLYPSPEQGLVIEPFAGSAGYSVYYEPSSVLLVDLDPIIVGVWSYLIKATKAEIEALPDLQPGQSVDDFDLCQEAKWLIGFWINRGSAQPKKTRSQFSTRTEKAQLVWGPKARARIIEQQPRIRHWKVTEASFDSLPLERATYFIDPPYTTKGKYYRFKNVDFSALSAWIKRLPGLAIACDDPSATYLPFNPLTTAKTTKGFSQEGCYIQRR